MTECEICGSNATKKAEIDGVLLSVCEECAKYGEAVVEPVKITKTEKIPDEIPDSSKHINPNYPHLIKNAREKMNLKTEELAKKINERESVISNLETGHLSPSFELARKLEVFLGIKLILDYEEKSYSKTKKEDSELTVGDVVELDD